MDIRQRSESILERTSRPPGRRLVTSVRIVRLFVVFASLLVFFAGTEPVQAADSAPTPLLSNGHPVDWWFVFKFNTAAFPGCGGEQRSCPFGGEVRPYKLGFGQQFVYASSEKASLQKGSGCVGETPKDPLGATFSQIYTNGFFYVIWNDQFKDSPKLRCTNNQGFCDAPWAHSKGMLAWNGAGDGLVLQVTTPSWPASGSQHFPRSGDGNTLGCVIDDNVLVSQHFFALKLTKDDLIKILNALQNASVATDLLNRQLVHNGGPADVQKAVTRLGVLSPSDVYSRDTLSTGVEVISKPSRLNVPPWQMVSAVLGGVPLRTATWWSRSKIPTTTASSTIACWDPVLGHPGPVEIATTGQWGNTAFGLTGAAGRDFNHAKIGVSLSATRHYAIFGDMNQEGTLSPIPSAKCAVHQNARGGLFFVLDDRALFDSITGLLQGQTGQP